MRNIIWFFALLLLLLFQAGILLPLHIAPANLIVVIVALATILSEFRQGLIITLLGGLMLDFISGSSDGLITMSLLSVFLLLHVVLKEFLSREPNRFILAATILAGTLIYYVGFIAVNRIFELFRLNTTPDVLHLFTVQLPLALMWNLVFAFPIFHYYLFVQKLASKIKTDEEPIRT